MPAEGQAASDAGAVSAGVQQPPGFAGPQSVWGVQAAGGMGERAVAGGPGGSGGVAVQGHALGLQNWPGSARQSEQPTQPGGAAELGHHLQVPGLSGGTGSMGGAAGLHAMVQEPGQDGQGVQGQGGSNSGSYRMMDGVVSAGGAAERPATGLQPSAAQAPGGAANGGGPSAIEASTHPTDKTLTALPYVSGKDAAAGQAEDLLASGAVVAGTDGAGADSDSIPDIDSGSESE